MGSAITLCYSILYIVYGIAFSLVDPMFYLRHHGTRIRRDPITITIINIPDGVNEIYETQCQQSFNISGRGLAWCI